MPILAKTRWLLAAVVAVAIALQAPATVGANAPGKAEIAKLLEDLTCAAGHKNVAAAMALSELFDAKNPNRPAEGLDGVVGALAKRLQANLTGPNAMVIRVSCADALGKIRTKACVPPLKWALDNGDAETAIAAADALARALPAEELTALMRKKLDDGSAAARAVAAKYVARIAGPGDIAALGKTLAESTEADDWRTRERCANALAALAKKGHKLPAEVCEALVAAQADPTRNVVDASVAALRAALANSRDELLPLLAKAAATKDDPKDKEDRAWHVREVAITLLGETGMPHIKAHLPVIVAGLGDDVLNVVRAARKALGRLPRNVLVALLTDTLKTTAPANVKAGALAMIGSIPAGEHTAATAELALTLLKESTDVDNFVEEEEPGGKKTSPENRARRRLRAAAVKFLGSAGITKAAPDIARGVSDDSVAVRRAATAALRRLKLKTDAERAAVVAVLAPVLAGDDWRKATAAANALAGCPHADAIGPLIEHGLANTTLNVQRAATKVLVQYGSDPALKTQVEKTLLATAGDDDGSPTWEFGAVVFGELKTKAAVSLLITMLSEPPVADEKSHWRVQVHAAEALGAIGDGNATVKAALRVCAKNKILQVKEAASQALSRLGER